MTHEEFFRDYIVTWEGGLSLDPDDAGNWFASAGCRPVLTGSKYGVTAAALAAYRGCARIAPADMRALTIDEAVRLGQQLYYARPGFDRLPWDPLVASLVDFGWGAGPRQAATLLQRLIGIAADGAVGARTVEAYRRFVAVHTIAVAARTWREARDGFYRALVATRPADAKYLHGWLRRSTYFAPGGAWWGRFTAATAQGSPA